MNTKILWPVGCAGALVIGWFIGFVMGGTPEVGNHTSSQPPMQTSAPSASKITRAAQQEPTATNDTDARAQMQTILGALHDTNYLRRTRNMYDAILKIPAAELASAVALAVKLPIKERNEVLRSLIGRWAETAPRAAAGIFRIASYMSRVRRR